MKRLLSAALLLMLLMAVVPTLGASAAPGSMQVRFTSHYYINRYGFAVANETVVFVNNETSTGQTPSVQLGLGDLTQLVKSYAITPGYTVSETGETFTVSGGQSLLPGNKSGFTFSAVVNGIVSTDANGTLEVLLLMSPSLSIKTDSFVLSIMMPGSTPLASTPSGFTLVNSGTNTTYTRSGQNALLQPSSMKRQISTGAASSAASDFHPLEVYSASRTVSMGAGGVPVVTDSFSLKNLGKSQLKGLILSPMTSIGSRVTVLPSTEPRLLSAASVALTGFSIDLTNPKVGFPVQPGGTYAMSYQYPLASSYYSISGGVVTLSVPFTPPIPAFAESYSIGTALPAGVSLVEAPTSPSIAVGPRQSGSTTVSYSLTPGWAIDDAIPVASLVFVLLLMGLYLSRTTLTEAEETEEESSTERASAMIKAFEEKTSLINGLWPEIKSADPNEMDKTYFDEIRGRLDSFRSRALQRLNEVKQKSTSQRFFDLLSQIHTTEREVDRAVKDTLNLYEQFYTRRMRKEVFDRLVPQYTKRLEKALNQLSDELHVIQREAKLL